MQKLNAGTFQAEDLKSKLASQETELQLRNQDAEALIAKIGIQTEKVSQEKTTADAEEQKVSLIPHLKECEDDLLKAEPAVAAATAALDTLNKVSLTELKAFTNPPMAVINVIAAVMVLLAYKGKIPKDRSWKATKVFMGKLGDFLEALNSYDKEHIPQNCLRVVKEHYLKDPDFNPNYVRTKSFAAAGLCAWIINIVKFNEVEPKHCALAQANAELTAATEKLEAIRKKLLVLDSNLRKITASLEKAVAEKVQASKASNHHQKVPIPVTEGLDPIATLTDDATIAAWNPQQQGIKWIKNKYGADLKVVHLGQKGFLKTIERALTCGETVLIKNMGESIDPVLDPLLGRHTVKKGKYIKIEDKACEFNKNFCLILHTKLANPHYKPELQVQTTLINFTVTRDGLEDQLLAEVVSAERPDIKKSKSVLAKQQNCFKTELRQLEDDMLLSLSATQGSFLDDSELVDKLKSTNSTAAEVQHKIAEAKENEAQINVTREHYSPTTIRASILYFVSNSLGSIKPIYQFSLKAFNAVLHKAIKQAEKSGDIQGRISNLTEGDTYSTFLFTSQELFEKDKLIFLAQKAFQILLRSKEIELLELDFLLQFRVEHTYKSPVGFLTTQSWKGTSSVFMALACFQAMAVMDVFRGLDKDIERSAKRWKKWVDSECPEKENLPQEWTNKSSLQKLIILRVLRPDRMIYVLRNFVEENLDSRYVESTRMDFTKSYEESSPATPVFFILSPGVEPLEDIETLDKTHLLLVQGSLNCPPIKERKIELKSEMDHNNDVSRIKKMYFLTITILAVFQQNIHLVAKWLGTLEKLLEQYSEESHPDFHVFISAEPAPTPEEHIIPQEILEYSIKITSEPPTGMLDNLYAALYSFHQVPWENLHYPFGEIMYSGHNTDAWDCRVCCIYLQEFISPPVLEGELTVAPGFLAPPNLDYAGYHKYIDEMLPSERPLLYGLQPNAEMGYLTTSDNLFKTLLEMQPMNSFGGERQGQSAEEKVKNVLDDTLEMLPKEFNMAEIMQKTTA
ncbi:unnamed protein product [Bubo scandiacus]